MTSTPRFLFDECVGKPHMEALREALKSEFEFVHIKDYFREGEKDHVWIPRLASETGWIVITADRGTHSKAGEKLPEICRANNLTHVVLSKAIHNLKSLEKIAAIRHVWDELCQLHLMPSGKRYLLRFKRKKGDSENRIVLETVDPNPKGKKTPRKKRTKKR